MRIKRFFSIFLGLALLLILLPQAAWAAQGSDFVVTGNPAGYTYGTPDGVLTFIADGSYTVSMAVYGTTTTTDTILVSSGVTANITLNNVSIELPVEGGGCAFNMTGSVVNLALEGANTLHSGGGYAGLQCPAGATLIISDGPGAGAGSLSSFGKTSDLNTSGAGIGGSNDQSGGTITIESGTVNASGSYYSAGIGGGYGGSGGTVTIKGGMVTATGGGYGAGIGGGHSGSGGTIIIEGGTVTATSGGYGAGIGGGGGLRSDPGGDGGTITIEGGTVTATGGSFGAGIGGGGGGLSASGGDGGTVTIRGGTVTASSEGYGAGIGGGFSDTSIEGSGGTVIIEGGTVEASGGAFAAGIGGSDDAEGGSIKIIGGTVTATGGVGSAGIGGGYYGGGGTVTISSGIVGAAGTDGGQDIGRGGNPAGGEGSLSIADTAAVFLRNDTCTSSVTTTMHTHKTITGHTADAKAYGIPVDWSGSFGAYLRLFTLSYDANGGAGAPTPVIQHIGTTVTVADDSGLAWAGHIFSGWDTAEDGAGTAYAAGDTFTFTANATLYAIWEDIPVVTYTVTYDGNSGTGTAPTESNKAAGATFAAAANIFIPPSGKQFKEWNTAAGGSGTSYLAGATVIMPASNLTLYAIWEDIPVSGGRSRSRAPVEPSYDAPVTGGSSLPVTVNTAKGNAGVNAGATLGRTLSGGGNATIAMPSIAGVSSYTLGIPVAYLSSPGGGTLTFSTDTGALTLPADMLSGLSGEGSEAKITIGLGDRSGLSDAVKNALGNRPLIEIAITIDGKPVQWNNPNAPVTVSIPYTPTPEELQNPDAIIIWYIDGSGNPVCIPNGRYDAATGTVTFATTHFSLYAVGYNKLSFNDVAENDRYYKAVSFIAAREITSGTGNGNYSPEAGLTRGEFIVLLMNAYGIAPDTNPANNFSDAGSTWYTGYLAAAKRLGISAGVGNNLFAPGKALTRQEMFTLLHNALKVIGQLPQGDSGRTLSGFTDANSVADWAKEAMTLLVKTGIIGGDTGMLTPINTATRAEMAQVLYTLLSK